MNEPSERSHWSQIEERGVYLGLRFMLLTYKCLGKPGFLLFLHPVTAYFFMTNAATRKVSKDFLLRIYNDPRHKYIFKRIPDWRDVYQHMYSFGEAVLDKLAAWVGDINQTNVETHNFELFDDILRSGRGGLLIASHLGNAEVSRALGSVSLGRQINVLVHTKHSENFNRVMSHINPKSTVNLIQVTEVNVGIAMMLHERVSRGEFVVIVGDRTPVIRSEEQITPRVSWAPFLGDFAPFPQGPFILAGLLECPVLTMFCLKKDGQHHIIFEHFADKIDISRKQREKALKESTLRYAARLESYCLLFPYQWFNFFDFWSQGGTIPAHSSSEESSADD